MRAETISIATSPASQNSEVADSTGRLWAPGIGLTVVTGLVLSLAFANAVPQGGRRVVHEGEATAGAILRPCGRLAPPASTAGDPPSQAQTAAFERALRSRLASERPDGGWAAFPAGWSVNYLGRRRGGRQIVEGSFAPSGAEAACAGGTRWVGAEYDIGTRQVTFLAFNRTI